jgi:hypothetical protein
MTSNLRTSRVGDAMSHKQKIAAFVSGILLFIVRAYVSPILDTSAPAGHYEFLGDGLFAYIVLDGFEPALLSLVLSLAWSWITLRWLARPPRVAVWWVLGGLIVGLMCWQLNDDVSSHYSCLDLIRQHPNAHWFPSPPDCSVLTNYLTLCSTISFSRTQDFLQCLRQSSPVSQRPHGWC